MDIGKNQHGAFGLQSRIMNMKSPERATRYGAANTLWSNKARKFLYFFIYFGKNLGSIVVGRLRVGGCFKLGNPC
jgi:hypothetical protein